MDPNPTPDEPQKKPPGRLRAAWRVFRGDMVVPDQITAEWAEYQAIFNDILKRWSAMLAREAKAERKRLRESLSDAPSSQSAPQVPTTKAELRSLAARRLGLGPHAASVAGPGRLGLNFPHVDTPHEPRNENGGPVDAGPPADVPR